MRLADLFSVALGRWAAPQGAFRRAQGAVLRKSGSVLLSQSASLHTVQWNGEELLVACTAQQVRVLARKPAPDGASA